MSPQFPLCQYHRASVRFTLRSLPQAEWFLVQQLSSQGKDCGPQLSCCPPLNSVTFIDVFLALDSSKLHVIIAFYIWCNQSWKRGVIPSQNKGGNKLIQHRMLLAFFAARTLQAHTLFAIHYILQDYYRRAVSQAVGPQPVLLQRALFLLSCMSSSLSFLNIINYLPIHTSSLSRSPWTAALPSSWYQLLSLAGAYWTPYVQCKHSINSSRLLIKMLSRTDPSVIPFVTSIQVEPLPAESRHPTILYPPRYFPIQTVLS